MNDQAKYNESAQQIGLVEPYGPGIGWAVKQLEGGFRVRRAGWNGHGQYLELQRPDPQSKMSLPYVFIRTVRGELVPWHCSQADLLARDWMPASA